MRLSGLFLSSRAGRRISRPGVPGERVRLLKHDMPGLEIGRPVEKTETLYHSALALYRWLNIAYNVCGAEWKILLCDTRANLDQSRARGTASVYEQNVI